MPRRRPSSRGALEFRRRRATARCRAATSCSTSSGGAPLFPAADLRDGYLRADPGDPAAVLRAVLKARDLTGTLRQAALHRLHRRSLRAFALQDRRLPPLPRSLPDRRDCARRRSCRDRRAYLRRLRPMRRRLPDRRRGLCAAAVRRAAAQAAHAAHRPTAKPAAQQPVLLFHDGEHGGAMIDALARHGDGLPANVLPLAGQRNHAGRPRGGRRRLRLWRQRRCASCCAPSRATTSPACTRPSRWPSRSSPASALPARASRTIETDDPDALGEALARDRADGRRGQARDASPPSAASAT